MEHLQSFLLCNKDTMSWGKKVLITTVIVKKNSES